MAGQLQIERAKLPSIFLRTGFWVFQIRNIDFSQTEYDGA